jgi:GDP-mannose transporter
MANVETVIVFRSCTPMAVCMFEYFIYRRALPSRRSCAALLLITFGAISYIATDREFQMKGMAAYYWAMLWWCVLIFQLTYGKFLVTGIQLKSLWTPVLFTNTLSIVPALMLGTLSGEFSHARLSQISIGSMGLVWLLLSCVIGIGISWAGFLCQSLITATAYSVVGVMNKMLTVTVNVLIWDKHASPAGISSLLVCLVGGSLYQQAPARAKPAEESENIMLRTANGEADEMDEGRRGGSKV